MEEMNRSLIVNAHQTLTRAHQKRRILPKLTRKHLLKQLQIAIAHHEEKIFAALKKDLGRARFETYIAEIAFINEEINTALKSLDTWCHRRMVKTPLVFQPGTSYVEPIPKGVVLIIAPWNYPFQLSLVPLVSAIAAGNRAVVKPSELAYESSLVIADIINQLDQDCVRAVCGNADTAQALLDLPFNHIFYTGSSAVGIEVMKKAAHHLTPVTLELGGKSPCIIDSSCDLSLAAKRIMWGKCLNAGQTCIAPDYVIIDNALIKPFITCAKQHLLSMFGENVIDSQSFGRIVNERHFNRLMSYLADGKVAHGGAYDAHENFIEPTILVDVPLTSPVMTDEIFGPILPIVGVKDIDEGIALINSKPSPLALYVFSKRTAQIKKVLNETISGGVAINDCVTQVGIPDLPFGGVGQSGFGSYHGLYGFETFSHLRPVHRRANLLDNPIKYAPYSDKKLKLARIVL